MLRLIKYITFLFLIVVLLSCSENKENIIGIYKSDKYVFKENHKDPKPLIPKTLIIKRDSTFELRSFKGDLLAFGTWKAVGKTDSSIFINFKSTNNKTTGILNGTIIKFHHPDIFYDKLLEYIIYVKQNRG